MSRKHKHLASVGLDGETQQQQNKRDGCESRDGKPFCTYDREKGTGVARNAGGRFCCEYRIQRDGSRVISIHAGDVIIKNP